MTARVIGIVLLLAVRSADAATLEVGPAKPFAVPSAAIAAARDGDTIRVDPAGSYDNDVALIARNNLTIESAGKDRVKLKTDGRVCGKKGIWVFAAGCHNLTIRGFEFSGARVAAGDGGNGAGLRSQGTNLTVTNCRFHDNQNGILGGGGTTTIEHCEFDHNGPSGLTHNVYIADTAGTLIFRFNDSHDTAAGHLLKSRSRVNLIEYNRLCDDHGTGSYELDLPNGGRCDVIGNIIRQSAASQNSTIIAYGEEGNFDPRSYLDLVHNTIVNDRANGTFVDAEKLPAGFKFRSVNNLFVGAGKRFVMTGGTPNSAGDLDTAIEKAGFVDAAAGDYRLTANSPAAGAGVEVQSDPDRDIVPHFEFASVNQERKRPSRRPPDVGAETTEK